MINLWLDDVREAPVGWQWAKTVAEAKNILLTGEVEHASLDHDLGCMEGQNPMMISSPDGDGIDLVKWMCETMTFPKKTLIIHSWNSVGAKNMSETLMDVDHGIYVMVVPYNSKNYKNPAQ